MADPEEWAAKPPQVRPVHRDPEEALAVQVTDGLWRLDLPLAYSTAHRVNAFALERDDGWCLVDCGSPIEPGWRSLAHALAQARVEPCSITLLLCTHAHPDHYGLAAEVMERTGCALALASGPTVAADRPRDPIVPLAERQALVREAGVPDDVVDAAVCGPGDDGYYERPEPDVVLRHDDLVDSRLGPWRVVDAPGHSATQVVLFHERDGLLLSADLAFAGRLPYVEWDWTPDPWAEHMAAVERAQALRPRRLLPGHGDVVNDAERRLAAVAGAAAAAPGRVAASIADGPRSAFEVVNDVLGPDATFYERHAALSPALCLLDRLVARGEAEGEVGEDGVRRFAAISYRPVV